MTDSLNIIVRTVAATIEGERNAIANMANTAAVLFHSLPDINWVGFYLADNAGLVLGPFQGNVACIRLAEGRGVCGAAVLQRKTIVVPDVHEFPDHIACDAASRSEVVVPIIVEDKVIGVLDVDSPLVNRFSNEEAAGLEKIVQLLVVGCNWNWLVTN